MRRLLSGKTAPGCVKARLIKGLWHAHEVSGYMTASGRRLEVNLMPTGLPPALSRRARLRAPYDGCEIGGLYGDRWNDAYGTRTAVEIPLTLAGRKFFNDRAAARDLAYFVRSGRVQRIRLSSSPQPGLAALARRYPGRVVTLTGPSRLAPEDAIGFWVGQNTIIFRTTSSTGRHFFVVAKRAALRLPTNNLGDLAFVF